MYTRLLKMITLNDQYGSQIWRDMISFGVYILDGLLDITSDKVRGCLSFLY